MGRMIYEMGNNPLMFETTVSSDKKTSPVLLIKSPEKCLLVIQHSYGITIITPSNGKSIKSMGHLYHSSVKFT